MRTTDSKKILIVEDDPKSLYALQMILQDRGYDVHAFASAEDASANNGSNYHAAIIDVRLPDEQGPVFARRLHEHDKACRIIFVTAYNSIADIRESIPGAVVLVKPLELDILTNILKS